YSGAAATGSRTTQARDSARVDPRESNSSEGARDAEVRADKFSVPTDVAPPSEKATSDAADQPRSASTQSPAQPPAVPKENGEIARLPKVPVRTQARGVDRADPGIRTTPTLPASAAAPFAARAEKPESDVGVEDRKEHTSELQSRENLVCRL